MASLIQEALELSTALQPCGVHLWILDEVIHVTPDAEVNDEMRERTRQLLQRVQPLDAVADPESLAVKAYVLLLWSYLEGQPIPGTLAELKPGQRPPFTETSDSAAFTLDLRRNPLPRR